MLGLWSHRTRGNVLWLIAIGWPQAQALWRFGHLSRLKIPQSLPLLRMSRRSKQGGFFVQGSLLKFMGIQSMSTIIINLPSF